MFIFISDSPIVWYLCDALDWKKLGKNICIIESLYRMDTLSITQEVDNEAGYEDQTHNNMVINHNLDYKPVIKQEQVDDTQWEEQEMDIWLKQEVDHESGVKHETELYYNKDEIGGQIHKENPHNDNVCKQEEHDNEIGHQQLHVINQDSTNKDSETESKLCQVCNKTFVSKSKLRRHMLTHTGEKPHKCNICEKAFFQACLLKRHLLKHTGENPHKCDLCQKQFSDGGNLKRHMLTHAGQKLHPCDLCEKSFARATSLTQHTWIHTGEKPHTCSICEKQFTTSGYLNINMLPHTVEIRHRCTTCGKQFYEAEHLNWHMLTHTGEKPYKCNL